MKKPTVDDIARLVQFDMEECGMGFEQSCRMRGWRSNAVYIRLRRGGYKFKRTLVKTGDR